MTVALHPGELQDTRSYFSFFPSSLYFVVADNTINLFGGVGTRGPSKTENDREQHLFEYYDSIVFMETTMLLSSTKHSIPLKCLLEGFESRKPLVKGTRR